MCLKMEALWAFEILEITQWHRSYSRRPQLLNILELAISPEDNIKMDLQEMGWGMEWIDLAQDRDRWQILVNTVMNLWVP